MKSLRKNLFDRDSWQDIRNFVIAGESVTLEQKIEQISGLMLNLPRRKFILIGDSGEKDPEVYRAMIGLFPGQVREVRIRDILGKRLTDKAGDISINIIPADTVFFETKRIAEKKKTEAVEAKAKRRNSQSPL
jgi:phosphatidate phosphatase APP1